MYVITKNKKQQSIKKRAKNCVKLDKSSGSFIGHQRLTLGMVFDFRIFLKTQQQHTKKIPPYTHTHTQKESEWKKNQTQQKYNSQLQKLFHNVWIT